MTTSYTTSTTFTRTHAAYLASKVGTDLYQCHRRYGRPSQAQVDDYIAELEELLAGGYVAGYEFGFLAPGRRRVLSWSYTVTSAGISGGADDRAGGVYLAADVAAADWFNFMYWSDEAHGVVLPAVERWAQRAPLFVLAGDVGTGKTEVAETIGNRIALDLHVAVTLYALSLTARGKGAVGEMTTLLTAAFTQVR